MTGFGKSRLEVGDKIINIEIKTLNSKHADIYLRMPAAYRQWELPLRRLLSQSLRRGKIELSLFVERLAESKAQRINTAVVNAYLEELKGLSPALCGVEALAIAMRLPDTLMPREVELVGSAEWEAIEQSIAEALTAVNAFRTEEGSRLASDVHGHIDTIRALLEHVPTYESERIARLKLRLRESLDAAGVKPDENRFEQELIYYMEKLDIGEEKMRLETHLNYFLKQLKATESKGKALNFITQEIGREINTLGAKSNHAALQKIVVQMKEALEKIKEQLLNIL